MKFVLAIEPDARQAASLRGLIGERIEAGLVLVDSIDAAIRVINDRVPDLILVNAFLPPQEERDLIAHLRAVPGSGSLQLLTIPSLTTSGDPDRRKRWSFGAIKRRTASAPAGCDPSAFADQLALYLDRIRDGTSNGSFGIREKLTATFGAVAPPERRQARRFENDAQAEALVDDRAALLIDLSVSGAQFLSPAFLWRPGQLVRVVLSQDEVVQCQAGVVWGSFDLFGSTSTPCYRAGVSFKDADPRTIERLLSGSGSFRPKTLETLRRTVRIDHDRSIR